MGKSTFIEMLTHLSVMDGKRKHCKDTALRISINLPTHRTLYPTTEKYTLSSNIYGPLPKNEPYAEPCHKHNRFQRTGIINYIFGHCVIKSELNKTFTNI